MPQICEYLRQRQKTGDFWSSCPADMPKEITANIYKAAPRVEEALLKGKHIWLHGAPGTGKGTMLHCLASVLAFAPRDDGASASAKSPGNTDFLHSSADPQYVQDIVRCHARSGGMKWIFLFDFSAELPPTPTLTPTPPPPEGKGPMCGNTLPEGKSPWLGNYAGPALLHALEPTPPPPDTPPTPEGKAAHTLSWLGKYAGPALLHALMFGVPAGTRSKTFQVFAVDPFGHANVRWIISCSGPAPAMWHAPAQWEVVGLGVL